MIIIVDGAGFMIRLMILEGELFDEKLEERSADHPLWSRMS